MPPKPPGVVKYGSSYIIAPRGIDHTDRRKHEPILTAPFRLPDQPSQRPPKAKYFRAFGDATRLHILELLRVGELSVGEIVAGVGTSQPRISAHLACLRWCGFVTTRREHRTVYYRWADDRVGEMLDLAAAMLADNAEHIAACRTIDGC